MFPVRRSDSPGVRLLTPERTARLLRVHFARHNLGVLALAAATLIAATALWLLLYGVCCWLLVLGFAAVDLGHRGVPPDFDWWFAGAAAGSVLYAWIDRRLTPNERPRDDRRAAEIAHDFLLAIPRITLAIGGTLAAWQRLSAADLEDAAVLLHRVAAASKLPITAVPLEIPDAARATRILFALQLTQVIDTHRDRQEFWLKLNPLRPDALRFARGSYAHP